MENQTQNNEQKQNKPTKQFVDGAIRASVWTNERTGKNGKFTTSSVTVQRRYLNANGQWATTTTLRRADIAPMLNVLSQAKDFLSALK